MNRQHYRLAAMVLMAFFLGIFVLAAARPAVAAGTPWVRWKIDLTYPNNKPDARLVVEKGHTTTSGQHVIDQVVPLTIPCQAVGVPVVANGQMTLDGSSYLRCTVPSIQDTAWQLWQIVIPDTCPSKRPYVTGRLTINGSPIDPTPENPVFFRDDIQFNTPLDVAAQNATLAMTFDQASAASGSFAISPAGHDVTSYFTRTGPSTFSPSFEVDGNSLSAAPAMITQSRTLSTLDSVIYYGYSPQTGEYFSGALGPLEVDPVCTTTG